MKKLLHIILPFVALMIGSASVGIAEETGPASFTGKLLVADTSLKDPRFARSVIYLVRHDSDGALGLIINKPLAKLPLADLLRQLEVEDVETDVELDLYFGGPVRGDYSFVLHSSDFAAAKATATVDGGFAVSDVRRVLRAMSEHRGPEKSLFAVGYAGWAPASAGCGTRARRLERDRCRRDPRFRFAGLGKVAGGARPAIFENVKRQGQPH